MSGTLGQAQRFTFARTFKVPPLKRLLRILRNFFLILIALVALLILLVNVTGVQNFLAGRAASMLADKLHTRVSIDHVRIDFANRVLLQGLIIEDQKRDTLLYAGELELKMSDWFFLKKEKPVVSYLGLHNAFVRLNRPANSKDWNYQFVIDAFDSGPADKTKSDNQFELDLKHLDLKNVRFHSDDAWAGSDMDIDVGSMLLDGKEIDLKKRIINLNRIAISGTQVVMRDYKGGKPPTANAILAEIIDTTAFNTGNWLVQVASLDLKDCRFANTMSAKPALAHEFDADHLDIKNVNLLASDLTINGDTLRSRLQHFTADERCGLKVRELTGDVTVSPNKSEVLNLLLKTENSTLRDSYGMYYERFPDFTDYIVKVRMKGELKHSQVSPDDIAYFATDFKEYFPGMMQVSGSFNGTVADFTVKNFSYKDAGSNATGDLSMKGLPDIDKTLITLTNASVNTTGEEIFRFAPMLRNNSGIDFSAFKQINYTGSYIGYIDDFAADGTLKSNLGTIISKSRLTMPAFDTRKASYSSDISATNFQLGPLFRASGLGAITFKGKVSGSGFEPHNAAVKVNAEIASLFAYGYTYHNIYADGVLERKKFDGKILVDDPNLALSFEGAADISGPQPVINASAHLLHSNLQALGLTSDSVEASADFDVDATGSNIDNFLGDALLNNINVSRSGHRIAVDSVWAQSTLNAVGEKRIFVASNDFTASATGHFQLSKLPYSAQYVLAQYLPSYVASPKKYAPDQNLIFTIETKQVDSLFAAIFPFVKGFNNTRIEGLLNTTSQELDLKLDVPEGQLGNVHFNRLSLQGDGDFAGIKILGSAANIMIGDSLLRISMDLSSRIAHDSIGFSITTSSPASYGTATLHGQAIAKSDSIFLNMAPSEFFLNQSRWEIGGGSTIVYRPGYLRVADFRLHSDLQSVDIYTRDTLGKNTLVINAGNLDLAQLSGVAGLSSYAPDGRVNGNVRLTDLFTKMSADANFIASGVSLGKDTVGDIIVSGNYDGTIGQLRLNEGSGIFRGSASLAIDGTVRAKANSSQALNGKIQLTNAPLNWLNPVLLGYVSQLSGTANGTINISGTGESPDVAGKILLNKASFRVDYLGTTYTVPTATIGVSSTEINLGNITVHDVFDNDAILSGKITHERLKDIRLGLRMTSDEFEVLNLKDYESDVFYGHLVANVKSMSVSGPINDVRMNIVASPADLSQLYLPIATGGDIGSYSYVSFKKYGEEQVVSSASQNKLTINIDAIINPLAEVTLILDPTTGDAINARGTGNLRLEMPAGGDLRMYGNFNIDQGDYTFTFRQLFFKRQFQLSSGSSVHFSGPMNQTTLDVAATYRTRASLYDLLSEKEKSGAFIPSSEMSDTKRAQDVDVLLKMTKNILHPDLSFQLSLPEKRSVGTYAYSKFERLNSNELDLFNQVASLLLIGYFIPPEGLGGSTAATGAINNLSEILSTSTSAQLTNIVNKLLGDPKLSVDLKYKNYNVSDDPSAGFINRNEVKLGLRKNLLNDRLVLEVGSSYDWGRPLNTSSNSSNFNLLNDFRVQYLLTKDGRFRFNGFRTTDYDVLISTNGGNITRSGVGISWRKTFDSFSDFWHTSKYFARRQKHILEEQQKVDTATINKTIGTN